MTTFRSVVFDLDDTLYDESTYVAAGFGAAASVLSDEIEMPIGEIAMNLREIEASWGRGKVFDRFLESQQLSTTLVPAMVNAYRSCKPRLRMFADAHHLLMRLKRSRVPTAVVTDGYGLVQDAKVRSLGLASLVDTVIYTDAFGPGHSKPSTTGFEVAMRLIGGDAESSVYVGNDVRKDFAGPRNLGMQSILVSRRMLGDPDTVPDDHLPDLTFETLADLDRSWEIAESTVLPATGRLTSWGTPNQST